MILLDTHVLLRRNVGDRRLGASASRLIDEALQAGEGGRFGSHILGSCLACREETPRFRSEYTDLARRTAGSRAGRTSLEQGSCLRAAELPGLSGDPVDRLIVSTALNGHRLMTADRRILDWPGQLDRIPASE